MDFRLVAKLSFQPIVKQNIENKYLWNLNLNKMILL